MKKTNISTIYFSLILLVLCYQSPFSQVTQNWVKRYNAPGNGVDMATSIAVDGSGNVFVTGGSHIGTGYDNATIKYNSAGAEQWVRRINGTENYDFDVWVIAADLSGNSYVTGANRGDFITVKYNPSGDILWDVRYNGTGNGGDKATSIALDRFGNVYVTGYSYGSESNSDYATIKYDSNGVQQWVARYNGTGNFTDVPWSIAIDTTGNVYVTGQSNTGSSNNDFATIKYNSSGIEMWVSIYNGSAFSYNQKNSVIADNSGNVYVTGSSWGGITGFDFATIKYNSSGIQEWASRYNGESNANDQASAVTFDDSGNVYVTGGSYAGSSGSYATVKYNSLGIQQWVSKYAGTGNWNAKTSSIALDHSGNIYVTGESGGNNTVSDFATIKYNTAGDSLWIMRYNGPMNSNEGAKSIAIDNSGNVYVTGPSPGNGTDWDYATVKYSQQTGVSQITSVIPEHFKLGQNYPNPFNPRTVIRYSLIGNRFVNLKVYDILGKEVSTLVNEKQSPGMYQVEFDGSGLPSGIYFYKLTAGEFTETKRMMLVK